MGAGLNGIGGIGVCEGCVGSDEAAQVGGVGGHVHVDCGGCQVVGLDGHCAQVVVVVDGEDVRYRRPLPGGDHFWYPLPLWL